MSNSIKTDCDQYTLADKGECVAITKAGVCIIYIFNIFLSHFRQCFVLFHCSSYNWPCHTVVGFGFPECILACEQTSCTCIMTHTLHTVTASTDTMSVFSFFGAYVWSVFMEKTQIWDLRKNTLSMATTPHNLTLGINSWMQWWRANALPLLLSLLDYHTELPSW